MRVLLAVACIAIMSINVGAQTITWNGDGATDNWSDANNWDTDMVPGATDEVLTDGGDIIVDISATVQRVRVSGGSDFTINSGVTLTIDGFAGDDDGIESTSSSAIINDGTIIIRNILGGSNADGMVVQGPVTNNGTIDISNVGGHGLRSSNNAVTNNGTITITNVGNSDSDRDHLVVNSSMSGGMTVVGSVINNSMITITVINADDGVSVEGGGTFTNSGTLTINMSAGDDGIYMTGASSFDNNSTVTIDAGTGDNGIRVDGGSMFNNNLSATFEVDGGDDDQIFLDGVGSTFSNSGTIDLTNADGDDAALYVTDASTFNNNSIIDISGHGRYGVQIDANLQVSPATINNAGTITVDGGGNDALRIQENGIFNNQATGTFTAMTPGADGIELNADNGGSTNQFNNSGIVDIDGGSNGMEIRAGTFANMSGGLYTSENANSHGIRVRSGAVSNDGNIRIDNSGSVDIETDDNSFTNGSNATYAPGSSPGDLTIKDDFDFGSATIVFEIEGTAAADFDVILHSNSSNTLDISNAGANIEFTNGFTPSSGDCWVIVDAGSTSPTVGMFAAVSTNLVSGSLQVSKINGDADVEICFMPTVPVELSSFEGNYTDEGVMLDWQTVTEINNEGFEIERSSNNEGWEPIGFVEGKGTVTEIVDYSLLDAAPANGINYYRLKQMDYDGAYEYSKTIPVLVDGKEHKSIGVYPNPFDEQLQLRVDPNIEALTIQLHDISGKLIYSHEGLLDNLNTADLKAGTYILTVRGSDYFETRKLTKR